MMTFISNVPFVLDSLPVSEHMGHQPTWPDQLSPQLQRNKQVAYLKRLSHPKLRQSC